MTPAEGALALGRAVKFAAASSGRGVIHRSPQPPSGQRDGVAGSGRPGEPGDPAERGGIEPPARTGDDVRAGAR